MSRCLLSGNGGGDEEFRMCHGVCLPVIVAEARSLECVTCLLSCDGRGADERGRNLDCVRMSTKL